MGAQWGAIAGWGEYWREGQLANPSVSGDIFADVQGAAVDDDATVRKVCAAVDPAQLNCAGTFVRILSLYLDAKVGERLGVAHAHTILWDARVQCLGKPPRLVLVGGDEQEIVDEAEEQAAACAPRVMVIVT